MQTRKLLAEFLASEFMTGTEPGEIPTDYDLVESGVVDSLGVLKLVAFIEEHLQHSIAPESMTPENFRSLGAMLLMLSPIAEPSS